MSAKYIVVVLDGEEHIFVFPKSVDHDRMHEAIEAIRFGTDRDWCRKYREGETIAAGFVENGQCCGRSDTLGVESRGELDTALLRKALGKSTDATPPVHGMTDEQSRIDDAFESHRLEQTKIPGMPGLSAKPSFAAGWQAARSQTTATDAETIPASELTDCRHCGFRVKLNEAPQDATKSKPLRGATQHMVYLDDAGFESSPQMSTSPPVANAETVIPANDTKELHGTAASTVPLFTAEMLQTLDNYSRFNSIRVVVCAAIRTKTTCEVILGVRHYDPFMRKQLEISGPYWRGPVDQGFVDQFGVFMDRKEALAVAIEAGQVNTRRPKTQPEYELFSEDLY